MELLYGYTFRKFRRGGSLIDGRFVYTMKNKPIAVGHKKTGAYVEENMKLDARFRVSGFQEFADANASAPTGQLQRIRVRLALISYRNGILGRLVFLGHF